MNNTVSFIDVFGDTEPLGLDKITDEKKVQV